MPTNRTRKISSFDPEIGSADAQSSQSPDYRKLSFLHGATVDGGSNDMTFPESAPYNTLSNPGDWEEKWRAKQALRRHSVEQGMSTFSFPKKP